MELDGAIQHCEEVAEEYEDKVKRWKGDYPVCKAIMSCQKYVDEHRQLSEWLKTLKSAKFEYNEAWRTITHPTPDVTYADKQRAQMILDKFRNSLGAMK